MQFLSQQRPSSRRIVVSIGLAVAVLASYSSSFDGTFLYDDLSSIVDNPAVKTLTNPWGGANAERPLAIWTFAINYAFGGLDPWGYHAVNVSIHLANAVLVYLLLVRLARKSSLLANEQSIEFFAATTALLWAVHPLNTQSVTYIVQRMESLSGLFILLTCLLATARARRFILSLALIAVSCMCAVLCKPTAIVLPLLVALVTFGAGPDGNGDSENGHSGRITRRQHAAVMVVTIAACLFPVGGYLSRATNNELRRVSPNLATPKSESRSDAVVSTPAAIEFREKPSPWEYLRTQPEVIWHYVRLTVFPVGLVFDYWWPIQDDPRIYLPLGFLIVGWLAAGLWALKKSWLWGTLGLWPLILLGPTSSFIPIKDIAFEHRMYLATMGLSGLLMLALTVFAERYSFISKSSATEGAPSSRSKPIADQTRDGARASQSEWPLICLGFAVGLCALVFAAGTYRRNFDYHTSAGMWLDVADKVPTNPRALNNAASSLIENDELVKAQELLGQARTLAASKRLRLSVLNNDAYASFLLDDLARAEDVARQAIAIDEGSSDVPHFILGVVAGREGQFQDAIDHLNRAETLDPTYEQIPLFRGRAYGALGELPKAVDDFRRAAELAPTDPEIMMELGSAQQNLGNESEAVDAFSAVLAVRPSHVNALVFRSLCLRRLGQFPAALRDARSAVKLEPGKSERWHLLIDALINAGHSDEAKITASRLHEAGGTIPAPLLEALGK